MKAVTISLALLASACLGAGTSVAQDELAGASGEPALGDCLADADAGKGAREACIGVMAEACPGMAGSTLDMVTCLSEEIEAWDARLNEAYKALIAAYEQQDADFADDYDMVSRLREVQRGWIKWRDLKCSFAYDEFRGGTAGRLTGADCMLDMTARRVFELQDLLATAGM